MSKPSMKIMLGLTVASEPTFAELIQRIRARCALAASGQQELGYLLDDAIFEHGRLGVSDGIYCFDISIPVKQQTDMIGHRPRRLRGLPGILRRDDESESTAVDETITAVEKSANILSRVCTVMNTASVQDIAGQLRALEQAEHVDTQPARQFIYRKQSSFDVLVEDEPIVFEAVSAREAVSNTESAVAELTLPPDKTPSTVYRCWVHAFRGHGVERGLMSGGRHDFRFVYLSPQQKVILEGARLLQLRVAVVAKETLSTCTLARRPADVHQVTNWDELAEQTIRLLARQTGRDWSDALTTPPPPAPTNVEMQDSMD